MIVRRENLRTVRLGAVGAVGSVVLLLLLLIWILDSDVVGIVAVKMGLNDDGIAGNNDKSWISIDWWFGGTPIIVVGLIILLGLNGLPINCPDDNGILWLLLASL